MVVWPREDRLAIEHALRPGESTLGMANTLRLRGLSGVKIEVNGLPATLSANGRIHLAAGRAASAPE